VARTRRLIGLFTLLALVAIVIGVGLVDLPLPRSTGSSPAEQPLAGVRAAASTVLLRVGSGAPAGGELAFLALEPGGNLVVTDRARKSILRFDATGHLLSEWGPRLGELNLTEPAGVAVQGDTFYVLDRGTPRVVRLDASGQVQATFSLEPLGTYGLNGLAVDPSGNVYAADTGRNRILVLSPAGALLRLVGRGGSGLGEFTQPMGLTFLPDMSFVVTDWENSRLERWDSSFNATDAWSIGFHAWGVAADADGRVYAPDADRRRIVVYTPRGDQLGELGAPGSSVIDVTPRQVAIGPAQPRSLYVLGGEGIARLDLDNTPLPAQGGGDADLLSPIVLVLLLALPVLAVLARRRGARRSVAPTPHGEVRLHTEDAAQREQHQAHADQDLLVTHQPERKQHTRDQDNQTVRDRQPRH
jgi:DNA-binding beta-propeller fold protein YncE